MKSLGKRALSAALALCLMLFVLPLSAAAAPAGVTVTTPSIGGSTARLVTVTMTENRTADVALADGTIHNDSPAATLINRVTWDGNSTIVAAINGGFFNSYYNTGAALSYPGNCARIYSMVMYNGQLVNAVGQGNALGFTWEGEPYIDRVSFTPKVRLNGSVDLGIWAVNSYLTDPNAVCLFTPQVTLPYSVPAACRVVTVRNNVVTAISGGGRLSIPADGFVIVYNATAASNAVSWNSFPAVGTSAARFTVNTSTRTADQAAWNNMKTVVTGGRMLVQNGASVVDSAYYNATITAADQTSDSVAQRSFAAVLRNGQLVLGTATASFRQIANYLVSLGAKDAVSLDGGASSMLYVPGSGFLTAPGRELASALVIVDEAVHEGRPATIPQGDPTPGGGTGGTTLGPNDPSPWAEDAVTRGDALGADPRLDAVRLPQSPDPGGVLPAHRQAAGEKDGDDRRPVPGAAGAAVCGRIQRYRRLFCLLLLVARHCTGHRRRPVPARRLPHPAGGGHHPAPHGPGAGRPAHRRGQNLYRPGADCRLGQRRGGLCHRRWHHERRWRHLPPQRHLYPGRRVYHHGQRLRRNLTA